MSNGTSNNSLAAAFKSYHEAHEAASRLAAAEKNLAALLYQRSGKGAQFTTIDGRKGVIRMKDGGRTPALSFPKEGGEVISAADLVSDAD